MAIDKAFIEQLRDRLSIVDVISRYIPLSRKGKEHWGVCPFHSEKTGSFSVSEEKQFYHCFGCGAHGDIITFTMQHQHMSFIEAVEKLAADAGIEVPKASREERERAEKSHTLYEILAAAAEFYREALHSPEGRHALGYLKKRGLTEEIIANFRLCYAPGG
ncbi:MAG: DNA primase, partial [Rickettsiales bacterium]|nr:DNA primase [Rickettsiales bacterium]